MQTTAQTIQTQLGQKFFAIVGATQFTSDENSLQFKIGNGAINRANFCHIKLAADDTYTVTFINQRGYKPAKGVGYYEGVCASELKRIFSVATGFATSL